MTTLFRPLLASGVRLGVVPKNSASESKTVYEREVAELDTSVELEGSAEHMILESRIYEFDQDVINKKMYAERHRRVLKRWMDYRDSNNEDGE